MHTVESLRAFEESIRLEYEAGNAKGALHLSRGNEAQLIEVFKNIRRTDYVFSTYRSHYHALLHGVPREWLRAEILAGRSISINSREHRFFSSSIVSGCLPIAVGVALAIKKKNESGVGDADRVFCFVGDMAASCGMAHDCHKYARGFQLPITFVVEDNSYSTNTPTAETWGDQAVGAWRYTDHYHYKREWPHSGFKL